MSAACESTKVVEGIGPVSCAVSVTYVVLLLLHLRLPFGGGRLYAEDLLGPVLLVLAVAAMKGLRWNWWYAALCCFLGWCGGAAVLHLACGSGIGEIYEWCVFAYCGVVFLFFALHPLETRMRWGLGVLLCGMFVLCWVVDGVRWCVDSESAPWFSLLSGKMEATSMGFLARRYAFSFSNPNLAGSFASLGLLLLGQSLVERRLTRAAFWIAVVAGLLVFVALFFTMSKHGLLSLAVACGTCAELTKLRWRRLSWGWLVPVAAAAILFEATVLWVCFPVTGVKPYINTVPGMYTIHQKAYLQMYMDAGFPATGLGAARARTLYPDYVDRTSAERTLKCYNSADSLDSFCAYMDPHCEYLNLALLFGWGAVVLVVCFLNRVAYGGRNVRLGVFFVLGVLFCMLWDDILSKRWLWVSLGLLASTETVNDKKKT